MSLKSLEEEEVRIDWSAWRMPADANPPAKPEGYGEGAQRFLKELVSEMGLSIQPPTEKRSTRLAHTGGKYARSKGKFSPYHLRIFQAVWEKDEDIGDRHVLAGIAEEVGLDREGFLNALGNPEYDMLVDDDLTNADKNKIWTIPSYIGAKGEIQVHHYNDIPSLEKLRELL